MRAIESVIVNGLKSYLSTAERPCEVVMQNQVAHIPPYPYVSYTITSPINEMKGTYSKAEDGTLYRNILQTWSITVQSDEYDEALQLGMQIVDYFTAVGIFDLSNENIVVRNTTNLTARDNLLTIQYEYRHGLDVTFGLVYSIEPLNNSFIETIEINKNESFVLGKSKLGFGVLG
ncbi:MAG: hypothetical protein IKY67_06270 [Paludibacteraceae bacterium]|nr:hypothetical protein [Paludibacteraceae bacterium]